VVESRALLKLRASKGHRGFESLPHRTLLWFTNNTALSLPGRSQSRRFELVRLPLPPKPQAWRQNLQAGQHYRSASRRVIPPSPLHWDNRCGARASHNNPHNRFWPINSRAAPRTRLIDCGTAKQKQSRADQMRVLRPPFTTTLRWGVSAH
jgi:hypothetical protein